MINVSGIVSYLEEVKKYPGLHIQPVTPETLMIYFYGLNKGITFAADRFDFNASSNETRSLIISRGWKGGSKPLYSEMREKGMNDEEIIQELLSIEIEMWRIIEKRIES